MAPQTAAAVVSGQSVRGELRRCGSDAIVCAISTAVLIAADPAAGDEAARGSCLRRDLVKVPAYKCQPVGEACVDDPFSAAEDFIAG